MSQFARPVSDVATGAWTPTPVYSRINETPPNDASLVQSATPPQGDTFEVRLQGVAWPSPGMQTLTVRLRRTSTDDPDTTIQLLQGTRSIAGVNVSTTNTFTPVVLTLTAAEVAAITDYSQLRVRVTAGDPVSFSCCPNRLPAILRGAFTQKAGVFTAFPDTAAFAWNSFLLQWEWFGPNNASNLTIYCGGSSCAGLKLRAGATYYGPLDQPPDAAPSCQCNPVLLVYSVGGTFGFGSGGYKLTLTT